MGGQRLLLVLVWTLACWTLRPTEGQDAIQGAVGRSVDDAGAGILYSLLQAAEATAKPPSNSQAMSVGHEPHHGHEGEEDEEYYLYSNEDTGVSVAPPVYADHDLSEDYGQDLGGHELTSHEDHHTGDEPHKSSQIKPEQSVAEAPKVSPHPPSLQSQEVLGRPIIVVDRPQLPHPRPTLIVPRPQRPQRPQPPPVPSPPTPRRLPPVRAPIFLPRPLPTMRATAPIHPQPTQSVATMGHTTNTAHELDQHEAAHGLNDADPLEKTVIQESHEVGTAPSMSVHHGTNTMSEEKLGNDPEQPQDTELTPTVAPDQRDKSAMTSQTNSVMNDDASDLSPQPTSLDIVTEKAVTQATQQKELVLLGESVVMSQSTEEGRGSPTDHAESGEEYSAEEDNPPNEPVTSISVATAVSKEGDKMRVVAPVQTSLSVSQSVSTAFDSKASAPQTSAEDMTESTVDSSVEVTYGPGGEQTVKPEIVSSEKMGSIPNLRIGGTSVTKAESVVVSYDGHKQNEDVNPHVLPVTTPRLITVNDATGTANPPATPKLFSAEPSVVRTTINVTVSSSESVRDQSHFPTEPTTTKLSNPVTVSSANPVMNTNVAANSSPLPTTTTATTAKSIKTIFDRKTGHNITLQVMTESADVLSKFLPPGLVTTLPPQTETPVGKSLKTFLDKSSGKNVSMLLPTEDPSILAKLLPPPRSTASPSSAAIPMTPSKAAGSNSSMSKVVQTFFNKATGKNMTIALLTEDPSILAAMTPPSSTTPLTPANDSGKNVKVIFDKKTGRNITIQLATEDPSILAMMTPPPRPSTNTGSLNSDSSEAVNGVPIKTTITDTIIDSTTPPVIYHQGVQQSGKVHIITRHNVTRKPFLVLRATTKNPRPPPTFRKISDILNRNKTASTRRPLYGVRQQHEGNYQDDPEKRRSTTAEPVEITTIRTTTTLSPYFRWGPHVSVASTIKLVDGLDWSELLRDPQSLEFKQSANDLEGELDRFYRKSSIKEKYKGVQVDSFSRGSVIVDYTLYLKDDVRGTIEDTLKESYRTSIGNDTKIGKYKVDPLYVSYRVNLLQSNNIPTSATDDSPSVPHWAIAIAGVGAASGIFIIVLCLIMHFAKRATRRKYGAPLTDDVQQERKASVANSDKYAADKYAYDNTGAEGLYDLGDVWNEKKPQRSRNGSTSGYQSRSQLYSTNPHEGNPYAGTQSYQKDFHTDAAVSSHPPPKYYDAWNEWDDVYTSKKGSLRARDYDTTF